MREYKRGYAESGIRTYFREGQGETPGAEVLRREPEQNRGAQATKGSRPERSDKTEVWQTEKLVLENQSPNQVCPRDPECRKSAIRSSLRSDFDSAIAPLRMTRGGGLAIDCGTAHMAVGKLHGVIPFLQEARK